MKRKSPRVENSKQQDSSRKRRASGRNGSGNGNGNGGNPHEEKVFEDQPAIATLLSGAGGRQQRSHDLDRTKVLSALAALKKGGFSTGLPIDLGGIEGRVAD